MDVEFNVALVRCYDNAVVFILPLFLTFADSSSWNLPWIMLQVCTALIHGNPPPPPLVYMYVYVHIYVYLHTYVSTYLCLDLFFPKCFSDHQTNGAVANTIVYCGCFPYKFGVNNICRLETFGKLSYLSGGGWDNMFCEKRKKVSKTFT